MRSGKQLIILAFLVAAIVLGVYMTFFEGSTNQNQDASVKENGNMKQEISTEESGRMERTDSHDYVGKQLPMVENETAVESYNNGKTEIDIYFANTDRLDQGKMPVEAQAVLCEDVQRYLKHSGYADVTELYINDESYEEDAEKITFVCFMDGYEETLQVEYWFEEQTLKYFILNSDEYGAGGTDAEGADTEE